MVGETWSPWTLILGMAVISIATRAVFILPAGHLRLSPMFERVLRYAPAAALTAIVIPDLIRADAGNLAALDVPRLAAGLTAIGVAWATRNILVTILVGMLVFTIGSRLWP